MSGMGKFQPKTTYMMVLSKILLYILEHEVGYKQDIQIVGCVATNHN